MFYVTSSDKAKASISTVVSQYFSNYEPENCFCSCVFYFKDKKEANKFVKTVNNLAEYLEVEKEKEGVWKVSISYAS